MQKIFILGLASALLFGCSGSDKIVQNQEAIDSAKSLRSYFDKSNGDFKTLSASDQASAEKLVNGNSAAVQKLFDYMKSSNKTPVKQ